MTESSAFYFVFDRSGALVQGSKEQWEREWLDWYNKTAVKHKKHRQPLES